MPFFMSPPASFVFLFMPICACCRDGRGLGFARAWTWQRGKSWGGIYWNKGWYCCSLAQFVELEKKSAITTGANQGYIKLLCNSEVPFLSTFFLSLFYWTGNLELVWWGYPKYGNAKQDRKITTGLATTALMLPMTVFTLCYMFVSEQCSDRPLAVNSHYFHGLSDIKIPFVGEGVSSVKPGPSKW